MSKIGRTLPRLREPLNAVPLDDFRTTVALHSVQWPQALAEIAAKRQKLRSAATRRKMKIEVTDGAVVKHGSKRNDDASRACRVRCSSSTLFPCFASLR